MTQTIGFIGLGLMGAGFTKRLVSEGCTVVGFDLDASKLEEAKGWHVKPAASLAELAEQCDFVCICVTTTKAVAEVVSGKAGIVSAGNLDGKVIVDFSTTEMATTKSVAATLAGAGAQFIDGPVSGGPPAAEAGTLAIMVGGDDDAIETALPVLKLLGQVTHMGPTGAGQATKLVNQALCLTNYCIVAEGLRIAQAYGVDAAKIPEALAPGLGNSAVLQAIFPRMVARDYAPRGYARQILKDLEMLHEATREQHIATPMTTQALTMFRMLVAQGHSELDGAAVVTLLPEPEAPKE
jgi:3-hydroxyisobutyrate dehydrogenase-like beta-hydroxyacid dehydrogenase